MAPKFSTRLSAVLFTLSTLLHGAIPKKPEPPIEVDVVVLGGGYAGLVSAYDLQQAGLRTVLLEAKEMIGGRSRTYILQSGPGLIELGATWINNSTQPQVWKLTEEFGLEVLEQYTDGDAIFQGPDGELLRSPLLRPDEVSRSPSYTHSILTPKSPDSHRR